MRPLKSFQALRKDKMDERQFKYDVAFSLLAKDEPLAREINDLLSDRYRTFLYSERQKEIAGADGELKFKQVFAEEARQVVVLYRDGWGKTPWTRMEEEAIRGRAYEEGYDFVKFVPLDEVQSVPKYVPKVQLWINALRFGAKGAVAVIEARLEELGASTRTETAVERAMRLSRTLDFKRRREEFPRTERAVDEANKSFSEVAAHLGRELSKIQSAEVPLRLELKQQRSKAAVVGLKYGLLLRWVYHYRNSLDNAYLAIEIWDGHPPLDGMNFWEEPKQIQSERFKFELLPSGLGGWTRGDDAFDAEAFAEFALRYYMDHGH